MVGVRKGNDGSFECRIDRKLLTLREFFKAVEIAEKYLITLNLVTSNIHSHKKDFGRNKKICQRFI